MGTDPFNENQLVRDLIAARERTEFCEQRLSEVLHLFYGTLVWILALVPSELESKIARVIHFKILQMRQGCPLGRRLIELDQQFGGLLETKGIHLRHWVYEPRENGNE
jgi:hypothetical protein